MPPYRDREWTETRVKSLGWAAGRVENSRAKRAGTEQKGNERKDELEWSNTFVQNDAGLSEALVVKRAPPKNPSPKAISELRLTAMPPSIRLSGSLAFPLLFITAVSPPFPLHSSSS